MAVDAGPGLIAQAIVMLGAAVVAAPIFMRIGLGTVLGYIAAGVLIGPVLNLIADGAAILHVAELGVALLLFIIGLELKPARLWALRTDIFGLGLAQVVLSGAALSGVALAGGMDWRAALVIGFGLSLSSTAFAMQLLESRQEVNTPHGRRGFAILLFQDLAIVPLLALVAVLSPGPAQSGLHPAAQAAVAVAAVGALILAGRHLLTPLFRIIANTGAKEAMIAAALLVVLGAGYLLQLAGLSMAMGAFIAGVMLAESSYRHELEADIEPFRGILLGLFFMAVGLSLDLAVIAAWWPLVLAAVPALMLVKGVLIYGVSRGFGSSHADGVRLALLLPQGGEFGFVLFTVAAAGGLFSAEMASVLIAVVTLSMATTPLAMGLSRFMPAHEERDSMEEDFDGAGSDVLLIGFSRFGQIISQVLLTSGHQATIIDTSAERIRQAAKFGFRIFFGDGRRKDVLVAAGIERAKLVAVCTHSREATDKIVDLIQSEYPDVRLFVRSYDRNHAISLRKRGVGYELRETLESALRFGRHTLTALGHDDALAQAVIDDVRRRDEERLELQVAGDQYSGREKLHTKPVTPEPLLAVARQGRQINTDAAMHEDASAPEPRP
ncbi:MAG: monovalent cation:proton antiporter-2 (CPA2) family protein [Rhizobiaceae bacterium]|nr:monovalent cation:proton antiporter-2 (CPA2) family protein [Rhizobiaceae bacterium]